MINIDTLLPQLAQDKANHVIYGAVLSIISTALIQLVLPVPVPLLAVGSAAVIGVAKEVLDKYTGGDPSVNDALATTFGGVLVAVASLL